MTSIHTVKRFRAGAPIRSRLATTRDAVLAALEAGGPQTRQQLTEAKLGSATAIYWSLLLLEETGCVRRAGTHHPGDRTGPPAILWEVVP
jgi:hypothetical protein